LKPLVKLGIWVGVILLLAVLYALTPVGPITRAAVRGIGAGIARRPGIAWAREQMDQEQDPGSASQTPDNMDEIRSLIEAGQDRQGEDAVEAAIEQYRRAVDLDEAYAPSRVALAGAYMQLGRNEEAIAELQRATELAPDQAFVWFRLGALLVREERYDAAIDALEAGLALDDSDADAHYWLGVALHYRTFEDTSRAVSELERSVSLDPEAPENHYQLALAYTNRDWPDDAARAIQAYQRVVALDPEQTEAYYHLGQLYMREGDSEQALEAWRFYVAHSDDPERSETVTTWIATVESAQSE